MNEMMHEMNSIKIHMDFLAQLGMVKSQEMSKLQERYDLLDETYSRLWVEG